MGARFDWDKELVTADPSYYRWNQWFFLKFMENGLAYRQMAPVDWCPKDQVVLAREQVLGPDRVCWRCGTPVIKRDLEQWFFRTTAYADELLNYEGLDLPDADQGHADQLDRPVGGRRDRRSRLRLTNEQPGGQEIRVFTTRPDTLFGATFMVLAPEHPLVEELTAPIGQRDAVEQYRFEARRKSEIDRLSTDREKTGVAAGRVRDQPDQRRAHPDLDRRLRAAGLRHRRDHGRARHTTSATSRSRRSSACPSARSWRRATREARPSRWTRPTSPTRQTRSWSTRATSPACSRQRAVAAITERLEQEGKGKPAVTYRLRDWLVSRQRAWGTPIPVVYCEADPSCGIVPVPYEELPVMLPDDFEFRPAAAAIRWRRTRRSCARRAPSAAARPARDGHHGHLRRLGLVLVALPVASTRRTARSIGARDEMWCPVESYTGGAEHAVLHLMYARFFAKALNDLGLVHEREPWMRLFNQGQILGADGERMSKSRGNVQDPDELVARYGADTVRLFLMFMGPWDQGGPWSPTGIDGVHRFLRRVWTVVTGSAGARIRAIRRAADYPPVTTAGVGCRRRCAARPTGRWRRSPRITPTSTGTR